MSQTAPVANGTPAVPALRDYQATGVDFLGQRTRALLCDDAGLGKSRQVIEAAARKGLKRVLVICPAVARLVWPAEFARWSGRATPRLHVPQPGGADHFRRIVAPQQRMVTVIAYDLISLTESADVWLPVLKSVAWDLIVLDEAHRLGHPGSNRTRRILGAGCEGGPDALVYHAKHVWALTGTPTPNHAGELFPLVRSLLPGVIPILTPGAPPRPMEQYEYEAVYCRVVDGPYGRRIVGSQNQARLRLNLAGHVLRRRKSEVLKELPPMDWIEVPLAGVQPPALGPEAQALVQKLTDQLNNKRMNDLPPHEVGDLLQQQEVPLASVRRLLGEAKIVPAGDYAAELLADGVPKLIVFAHHRAVVQALHARLIEFNPVAFSGASSDAHRADAVTRFQNDPGTRVIVAQIDAASLAITLTAARDVLFVECSWTPAVNYQAASRAHRLGQRDGVLVRFLYAPGTLDDAIMRTLARKTKEIAQLWE